MPEYWWEHLVPTLGTWTGPEKETPMELKITDEKVRAVAETCPDTKRVLKVLFPEAFPAPPPRSKSIEARKLRATAVDGRPAITNPDSENDYLIIASGGEGDRFTITSSFQQRPVTWRIQGCYLIPTFED